MGQSTFVFYICKVNTTIIWQCVKLVTSFGDEDRKDVDAGHEKDSGMFHGTNIDSLHAKNCIRIIIL